jgi:hypothetical protein
MQNFPASQHLHAVRLGPTFVAFSLALGTTVTSLAGLAAAQTPVPRPQTTTTQAAPATQAIDLADEVVRDVLTNFQRGMETHSLSRVLSVFDAEDMTDYQGFREQMTAFFRLHDNIKFRYQLFQVSADKDVGFAIADVEMDPEPRDELPTERRHSTQMRFELKRTPAGWRAIGLKPMDFFTQ